jgi:hypothetical protein
MPLLGRAIPPREAAKLMKDAGWTNVENLLRMLATADAESNLYEWAFHWNDPAEGGDGTTDWGYLQLNDQNKGGKSPIVDANGKPQPVAGGSLTLSQVATFAAIALDAKSATTVGRKLYEARGFYPWVAYTSGAWEKKIDRASKGIANMLREEYGVGLIA